MVKIKTKKQFTKKGLVKYLLEQENVEVEFDDCDFNIADKTTTITPAITGKYNLSFNQQKNCLELEAEEEITEETTIPLLLEKYEDVHGNVNGAFYNSEAVKDISAHNSLEIYMIDLDKVEMTLLWTREGGMQ